jgi:large subunit ribosomal protein L15
MNLRDVYSIRVPRTERRRLGRGWGSGIGKTSGRGEKGAGRRSGTKFRMRFEGGQMPLYRRLPKKGFTNHAFRVRFEGVNVGDLEHAFEAGKTVDLDALRAALLVPKTATLWKLLGDGSLTKAMTIKCDAASKGAKEKVEKAGGHLELVAGPVRARQDEIALRRERTATMRAAAVEAMRAEAKKAGKPKKAAVTGKAKKAAKAAKPQGAKPAGAPKPPASKKEQS